MIDFVLFVLILGFLIVGHEAGHFLAAKIGRVRVDEFGIGFPPRLAKLFQIGETDFTLNALPFGGFVRPRGENDPSVPGGLAAANKRVRSMVLVAGPAANILLAFVAFTAAFWLAAPDTDRVMITEVAPDSPAESVGLRAGDIILEVEGQPVEGFESLQLAVGENAGESTSLTLLRAEDTVSVDVTPRENPPDGQGAIGILLGNPRRQVGVLEAVQLGWRSTRIQFTEILRLPARLMQGEVAPEEARVTGFKGMFDMLAWAGEIDRNSDRPFLTLNLIGVISMGLAIANLLPIPALDGGRLLFVAIEVVLGRRIDPQHEGLAHLIGFAFLLILMFYINFQDFVNPITLPR